ncbi:MAG: imidazole glycerol phosphate synthase subunit HisH [Thermodesulfovibrionales bacterium]|nr:imidazole glycerol phosphate synthase subunit HisH [Thermodesulfovibrionales bacterium]
MIVIVDYGMGNLKSVEKAFLKTGTPVKVTQNPSDIQGAEAVVLPGVGAFPDCMRNLNEKGLLEAIVQAIQKGKPYLGICLGLQILFDESEEFGLNRGLGIIRGRVRRFSLKDRNLKIPHMGWNSVRIIKRAPIFMDIPEGSYFYFVHSYYVVPEDRSVVSTETEYGQWFVSSIWKDNIIATQFHPEKSQALGLKLLRNFVEFVKKDKLNAVL